MCPFCVTPCNNDWCSYTKGSSMEKAYVLKAIDLLKFAIKVNEVMMKTGHPLTKAPFSEEETSELLEEIKSAEVGIKVLEESIK